MRKIILIALSVALVVSGSIAPAVAREDVQSNANFYAQTSDGECGLEFTIAYGNRTIKGSIAWKDWGWRLRGVPEAFVVVDGKLADESEDKIFSAMVGLKGLAVGFYDGTVLPIDLVGFDPKPFVACVGQRLGLNER